MITRKLQEERAKKYILHFNIIFKLYINDFLKYFYMFKNNIINYIKFIILNN